ncbi:MAG: hypothetical protein HZY76_08035 [Anaerolineae bacterium]|nr:MAG: hypothetical protein HZY76_08035 [Anaerolineae bacterium]
MDGCAGCGSGRCSHRSRGAPGSGSHDSPAVAAHRGGPGGGMGYGVSNSALAEALGITTAELTTAQTNAQKAAIAQAVKDGLITQAQADALLTRGETRLPWLWRLLWQ